MVSDDCNDGDIRLVSSNGEMQYEGTVQVCVSKVWGTVCGYTGTGWGDEEARVVCTQLGALSIGR